MAKRGRPKKIKELSTETKQKVEQGIQDVKEGKVETPSKEELKEMLTPEKQPSAQGGPDIIDDDVKQEKKDKLKELMRDINKNCEDTEMIRFADTEPPKETIPFNHKELDAFCGGGGVYGNYVVFWGSEGVGKTSLAYMQIAAIQKLGKTAAYIDLEHTTDVNRMKMFGIKPEELLLIENANTAEEAMNIVIKLAKSKAIDLIVIDSIQAMTPKEENVHGKAEKDRPMEDSEIAALAKKMGKFLRRTSTPIYKSKCAVIMIGQARTGGIGTFITKDELTGGRAIKFWSMFIAYMRKGQGVDAPTEKVATEDVDEKGKVVYEKRKIGFDCVIKIEKTKKNNSKPELSELHIPYYFDKGFYYEQ